MVERKGIKIVHCALILLIIFDTGPELPPLNTPNTRLFKSLVFGALLGSEIFSIFVAMRKHSPLGRSAMSWPEGSPRRNGGRETCDLVVGLMNPSIARRSSTSRPPRKSIRAPSNKSEKGRGSSSLSSCSAPG